MIFSAIHMVIRMIRENDPDYSDIGMGFIVMGIFETMFLLIFFAGIERLIT